MTPLFMNDWVASSNDYMENVGSLSYAASKCGHISLRKKKKESHANITKVFKVFFKPQW